MSAVGPPGGLQRSLRFVHWLEDLLLTLLLSAMIAIAAAQILLRNLFDWNFSWGDPLTRILVLWVGLLGALAASRSNRHISIDLLSPLLRGRVRALVQAGTALFTAAALRGGRDGRRQPRPVEPAALAVPVHHAAGLRSDRAALRTAVPARIAARRARG
jgi:hypothetical protein